MQSLGIVIINVGVGCSVVIIIIDKCVNIWRETFGRKIELSVISSDLHISYLYSGTDQGLDLGVYTIEAQSTERNSKPNNFDFPLPGAIAGASKQTIFELNGSACAEIALPLNLHLIFIYSNL